MRRHQSAYRPTTGIVAQVMANLRPNRKKDDDGVERRIRRSLSKGSFERRVIAQATVGGVEYAFHATKGWRSRWVGA